MKKLLIVLVVLLASCQKEPIPQKWDANRPIYLNGRVLTKSVMSIENIVKSPSIQLSFYNQLISINPCSRGFSLNQRDTVNHRLLMWGTDIIAQNGEYETDFIEARDIILRINLRPVGYPLWDTVGYIPNSVIQAAKVRIKSNFDAGKYTEVYAAFDSAFVFYPITGSEWIKLKKLNLQ